MSGVTSSMSSSASLKTSLSSTRTTSIGSPPAMEEVSDLMTRSTIPRGARTTAKPRQATSFGSEQKWVMGLPALMHLDLEPGVRAAQGFGETVRVDRLLTEEDRQHLCVPVQQPLGDLTRHGVEEGAGGHRLTLDKPQELALLDLEATDRGRAGGPGDAPAAHRLRSLLHRFRVLVERPFRVESNERAEAGLQRVGRDDAHLLVHGLRRRLGGEDDVLRVGEDDDLTFAQCLDLGGDVRRRRIHRLTALDAEGTEALEEATVARPETDGQHPGHANLALEPLRAIGGLHMHVLDVDLLHHADGRGEVERTPGLVGVHVHLHRAGRAHDQERVTQLRQLALELLRIDAVALDEEGGAVAVLRKLL